MEVRGPAAVTEAAAAVARAAVTLDDGAAVQLFAALTSCKRPPLKFSKGPWCPSEPASSGASGCL